jgi:hypothetical protein
LSLFDFRLLLQARIVLEESGFLLICHAKVEMLASTALNILADLAPVSLASYGLCAGIPADPTSHVIIVAIPFLSLLAKMAAVSPARLLMGFALEFWPIQHHMLL